MKSTELASEGLHITEGVSGVYFYHLSEVATNARSLCGAQTMNTQIPVASWGVRGHLNEKWCAKCATMGMDALRCAGVQFEPANGGLNIGVQKYGQDLAAMTETIRMAASEVTETASAIKRAVKATRLARKDYLAKLDRIRADVVSEEDIVLCRLAALQDSYVVAQLPSIGIMANAPHIRCGQIYIPDLILLTDIGRTIGSLGAEFKNHGINFDQHVIAAKAVRVALRGARRDYLSVLDRVKSTAVTREDLQLCRLAAVDMLEDQLDNTKRLADAEQEIAPDQADVMRKRVHIALYELLQQWSPPLGSGEPRTLI